MIFNKIRQLKDEGKTMKKSITSTNFSAEVIHKTGLVLKEKTKK